MSRDAEIERLLDKQAIYEVLCAYCRGVDRCDVELVRSVYHEDSYDDHGYWKGRGVDFAAFVVNRLSLANSATTHSITNILIDIDDRGIARSEAQVMATLVRRDTDPVIADVMGGRYIDRLSKRDGVWGIDERTVVLDWTKVETWPSSEAPVPLKGFTWGKREDRRDPIYWMLSRNTLQG
ncbi:nuclear transport factor 2 family protein [Sphingomonas echinoides]|uniref:Nuclear transport factor 2 family protein n=1 Tax=Sphingomonas echinoides TaxID=59803 RepID=A0ABU4PN77_9SPHN|nr:nuclear transport factor 2 family protein [Sphingomonas echinoides]MDX5985105.1 nuclear transport factor 2 family protein [Sphingomonas echinoides]